jgi:hypothetical protein
MNNGEAALCAMAPLFSKQERMMSAVWRTFKIK